MVDLIPNEYRRAQRLRARLRGFGFVCAAVALFIGAARAGLEHLVGIERTAMQAIRKVEAATGAQSARLAELQARRDAAEQQVKALESLRGRAVIGELFLAIDAAMIGKVWFDELSFAREGDFIDSKAVAQGPSGLASLAQLQGAPAGLAAIAQLPGAPAALASLAQGKPGAPPNPVGAAERAWLAQQRAQIRGHALDHSTLTEFINRLAGQPGIGQVRLMDTGARAYQNVQVVDFHLAAALGTVQAAPR